MYIRHVCVVRKSISDHDRYANLNVLKGRFFTIFFSFIYNIINTLRGKQTTHFEFTTSRSEGVFLAIRGISLFHVSFLYFIKFLAIMRGIGTHFIISQRLFAPFLSIAQITQIYCSICRRGH